MYMLLSEKLGKWEVSQLYIYIYMIQNIEPVCLSVSGVCCLQDIVWECVVVGTWKVYDSRVETGNEAATSVGANAL
jgi:hypothetical protein